MTDSTNPGSRETMKEKLFCAVVLEISHGLTAGEPAQARKVKDPPWLSTYEQRFAPQEFMKNYVANIVKQNPATNRDGTSARRPFPTLDPSRARAPEDSSRSTRPLVRRAICSVRGMPLAILAIGLIAGLGLMSAVQVEAQTFTFLHSFKATFGPQFVGPFTKPCLRHPTKYWPYCPAAK